MLSIFVNFSAHLARATQISISYSPTYKHFAISFILLLCAPTLSAPNAKYRAKGDIVPSNSFVEYTKGSR
jgi:hypothetical protein